jgi:alpha,alpha-trehalase
VYKKYYKAMQKEYKFWMEGKEKLKTANVYRRLVKMPDGSILNRHWDDVNLPRTGIICRRCGYRKKICKERW